MFICQICCACYSDWIPAPFVKTEAAIVVAWNDCNNLICTDQIVVLLLFLIDMANYVSQTRILSYRSVETAVIGPNYSNHWKKKKLWTKFRRLNVCSDQTGSTFFMVTYKVNTKMQMDVFSGDTNMGQCMLKYFNLSKKMAWHCVTKALRLRFSWRIRNGGQR